MKVAVAEMINCAHRLPGTEIHGHTYRVTVEASGKIGGDHLVIGFELLREHLKRACRKVDHRQLEDVLGSNPTAESLACWVREQVYGSLALLTMNSPLSIQVRVEVGDDAWVETE